MEEMNRVYVHMCNIYPSPDAKVEAIFANAFQTA